MKQYAARFRAFLLALSLLLSLAACSGGFTAATMHLRRTEGTVSVFNGSGKDILPLDNLSLYSGYGVNTRPASYAWIDLDDVKLAKLDQNSEIAIEKEGKALDIQLKSGSLFFNVTKPLADDETMSIRTSTMLVGIRGTSGWVTDNNGLSQVYILEGKVECSAEGQTVRVNAGEMAELRLDGELTVQEFDEEDLPDFVQDEVDPELPGGPDEIPGPADSEAPNVSEAPNASETPTPSAGSAAAQYRIKRTDFHTDAPVECYFERLVFDEITPGYAAINTFFRELETSFFNSSDVAYIVEAAGAPNAMYTPYSYNCSAEVTAQGQSYVSIQLNSYWYSGGARPDSSREHYTFSTGTGAQLGIQDFINAADEDILGMIKTELETLDGGANFIWFDYFSDWPLSKYDFYIADGAVHVSFDPGTIAMVAAGMIDITLPAPLRLN